MDWMKEVLKEIRVAQIAEDSDERLANLQSSDRLAGFYEGRAAAYRDMAGTLAILVEKAEREKYESEAAN